MWALSLQMPPWVQIILKTGFWPTECMMGWSIPKASYNASDGMARFLHWLPWLGKDSSHSGIIIRTSHQAEAFIKIINQTYKAAYPLADFESTEGCISSIDNSPETWGSGDIWQEEESVPPIWYKNDLISTRHTRVIVDPRECGTNAVDGNPARQVPTICPDICQASNDIVHAGGKSKATEMI